MPKLRFPTCALAVLLIAAVSACDSEPTDPSGSTPESRLADAIAADNPLADPTTLEIRDKTDIDVGDVEQALNVVGVLSDLSTAENIEQEIIEDRRERVRAVNITVNPPNPDALWLELRVDSTRDFVERPVVLDTKVLVEGELMDSFTIVLADSAYKNNFRRDVEVLFARDQIPETMLVTMESEALLLPEGIDWATTDPYSVNEGERTKAIAHSPIRIDFTAPGPRGRASEPAAPTETAEPSDEPESTEAPESTESPEPDPS